MDGHHPISGNRTRLIGLLAPFDLGREAGRCWRAKIIAKTIKCGGCGCQGVFVVKWKVAMAAGRRMAM